MEGIYYNSNKHWNTSVKLKGLERRGIQSTTTITYRGILEKGSDGIVSTVSYTIFTIHLIFWTQTADPISSKLFSKISPVEDCSHMVGPY